MSSYIEMTNSTFCTALWDIQSTRSVIQLEKMYMQIFINSIFHNHRMAKRLIEVGLVRLWGKNKLDKYHFLQGVPYSSMTYAETAMRHPLHGPKLHTQTNCLLIPTNVPDRYQLPPAIPTGKKRISVLTKLFEDQRYPWDFLQTDVRDVPY